MAFDLAKVFQSSAAFSLKKTATKIITWVKKNPLKALGLAVGVVIGIAAIWFLAPLAVAGVGAFFIGWAAHSSWYFIDNFSSVYFRNRHNPNSLEFQLAGKR